MSQNSQNKRQQYDCWSENARSILQKLNTVSEGRINQSVFRKLAGRFQSHNRSSGGDIGMARVQRDVGYFLLLTAQGYDFSQYTGDTRNFSGLVEGIKESTQDKYGDVIDLIKQAEEAIETNGEAPEGENLSQLTQSEVQIMVHAILNK